MKVFKIMEGTEHSYMIAEESGVALKHFFACTGHDDIFSFLKEFDEFGIEIVPGLTEITVREEDSGVAQTKTAIQWATDHVAISDLPTMLSSSYI